MSTIIQGAPEYPNHPFGRTWKTEPDASPVGRGNVRLDIFGRVLVGYLWNGQHRTHRGFDVARDGIYIGSFRSINDPTRLPVLSPIPYVDDVDMGTYTYTVRVFMGDGYGGARALPWTEPITIYVPERPVRMNWPDAAREGMAGAKVMRMGWSGKYLYYETALWWIQFHNATSGSLLNSRVILNTDFLESDFRALDWTYRGPPNQNDVPLGRASGQPKEPVRIYP
jgi:hypothetical protein